MRILKRNGYLLILLLFLVSIVVRLPNLNRPLSKHHEFNAALILIPMDIWEQKSAREHFFGPIMNFQNEGDRGINNITVEGLEKNGDFYYLSFPSATYALPYLFFKLFAVSPSPLALQIFNMFTHFMCIILLFQVILFITSSQLPKQKIIIPAVIASSIFLFSPTPLWFFGNGYTHHTLVIVFILWSILYALKSFHTQEPVSTIRLIKLFISLTLSILTAWSGYLLALILCCISIKRWYDQKQFQPVILVSIAAVTLGSIITYWQYSSIVGASTFIGYLADRFSVRSGSEAGIGSSMVQLFIALGKWYIVGYLPILIFLTYQLLNLKFIRYHFGGREKSFLSISIILVFSHHFLLPEFTAEHNYSVLIDGILISGIVGIFLTRMINKGKRIKLTNLGLFLVFLSSISQYYYINRIGDYGQNGDRYDFMQKIGNSIQENSSNEEVVLVMNLTDKPAPQVMYYAKRNFHHVDDRTHAYEIMHESNAKPGKLFIIDNQEVKEIVPIGN